MSNSPGISIVLVEPARPGNIGAAARAMKTMGFTDLRIVASRREQPPGEENHEVLWEDPQARAFAHGSADILAQCTAFDSLREAVADRELVIGTTARRRGMRTEYATPRELQSLLAGGERGTRIALVFGREESGLSNEELELCHIATSIPMRRTYPSLNLAQAVMVYCYELSPLQFTAAQRREHPLENDTMKVLHERAAAMLVRLGFDPRRAVYRRMMERLGRAGRIDGHLLLSLLNALDKHL